MKKCNYNKKNWKELMASKINFSPFFRNKQPQKENIWGKK